MVVWLILAVSWVCLRLVIVVFPDHTHLLFLAFKNFLSDDKPVVPKHVFFSKSERTNPSHTSRNFFLFFFKKKNVFYT